MKDIISAFPNLHYMTFKNMIYFNCIWLREIPPLVTLVTDMCLETTPEKAVNETEIMKALTTGKFFLFISIFLIF